VKTVSKSEKEIFPVQSYDWVDIENRLMPLVEKVIAKASKNK
jgi:hypothetical protein